MANTIQQMIAGHPGDAPAIGASGRDWMTYDMLRALSGAVQAQLRAAGISAQDRVAIVLPNGASMATAFVTIAQAATTAPLNPAYRKEEYAFYLEDLGAKALVIEEGYDGPALAAARGLGLSILRLAEDGTHAGSFALRAEATQTAAPAGQPGAAD
ncbi:MAG: AMP-binding protein, partial [Pseudomonadota bacterium]